MQKLVCCLLALSLAALVSSASLAAHPQHETEKLLSEARSLEVFDIPSKASKATSRDSTEALEEEAGFKLSVVTWNVGNEVPDIDSISEFFPRGVDVAVVGVQECGSTMFKKFGKYLDEAADKKGFVRSLTSSVSNKLILQKQIKIYLYIVKGSEIEARMVDKYQIQTTKALGGLLSLGFKGGAGFTVDIAGSRLTFISAHLAAHMRKLNRRNADTKAILAESNMVNKNFDATMTSDHVFFLGDLNYRVDPKLVANRVYDDVPDEEQTGFEEDHEAVTRAIAMGQDGIPILVSYDQLRDQRQSGQCFANFREPEIDFLPTFKVIKGQEEGYSHHRIPSYCDRVMWHSLPALSNDVRPIAYTALPQVTTSDHKPVIATFDVEIRAAPAVSRPVGITIQVDIEDLVVPEDKTMTVTVLGHPLSVAEQHSFSSAAGVNSVTGRLDLTAALPITSRRAHLVFSVKVGSKKVGEFAVSLLNFSGAREVESEQLYLHSHDTGYTATIELQRD